MEMATGRLKLLQHTDFGTLITGRRLLQYLLFCQNLNQKMNGIPA